MINRMPFYGQRMDAARRSYLDEIQRGRVLPGSQYRISISGRPPIPVKRLAGTFQNDETAIAIIAPGQNQGSIFKEDKR